VDEDELAVGDAVSPERMGIATLSLGVIEEWLRLCVDYAKSRELWSKPIGDLQLIQLKLAARESPGPRCRTWCSRSLRRDAARSRWISPRPPR
jgi:alkylation response protein AidB-like acyl-CoA dehydrogenase